MAAATGNRYIIEVLMLEFEGDPFENTLGHQTVMHCAAQRYEGVLSIFIFYRCHGIEVTQPDKKGATALHFATTNMLIKNVQALIKLGADVDARDKKGNTCLHLCINTLAEKVNFPSLSERANSMTNLSEEMNDDEERIYNEAFEKLKEIGKELLFSGAQRSARNNNGDMPLMLLLKHEHIFKPADFKKMMYVLSAPKGCSSLRLTRPIEKVERTTTIQVFMLLFDVINMAFFIIAASYN